MSRARKEMYRGAAREGESTGVSREMVGSAMRSTKPPTATVTRSGNRIGGSTILAVAVGPAAGQFGAWSRSEGEGGDESLRWSHESGCGPATGGTVRHFLQHPPDRGAASSDRTRIDSAGIRVEVAVSMRAYRHTHMPGGMSSDGRANKRSANRTTKTNLGAQQRVRIAYVSRPQGTRVSVASSPPWSIR